MLADNKTHKGIEKRRSFFTAKSKPSVGSNSQSSDSGPSQTRIDLTSQLVKDSYKVKAHIISLLK